MAVTFAWSFDRFDCYPSQDGHSDVVYQIHYTYTATENGVTGAYVSKNAVPQHDPSQPFVPFHELTPAQVEAWLVNGMGPEAFAQVQQGALDALAAKQSSVTYPAPWVS